MKRSALLWGATAVLAVTTVTPVLARPGYLMAFKAHYNTAQGKPALNAANCAMCHVGQPNQARWNAYGEALRTALNGQKNVQDRARVVQALDAAGRQTNRAANRTFAQMIQADRLPASAQGGGGGGTGVSGPGAALAVQPAGPWEPIFDGSNMNNLTKVNAGNWTVRNGYLAYTGGGNGWMRVNNPYTNYALVVVWRYTEPGTGQNNDSGVFLKARPGDNGSPWPNAPQLNMGPQQNFGSIGGTQGSRARFDLIKPNDWNTYQVTVQGNVATLAINNQLAYEFAEGPGLGGSGHIGIQCENRPFEIAQIWVRPLQ
jgi:hypothetical protein